MKIDAKQRTLNIKKNIIYSFLIKGASASASFLLVPLTIKYVDPVQYGIWVTIASLVAWINNFDIGLSNGLRNKLATDFASNNYNNITKYISTTYALLFAIGLLVFSIFFIVGFFFNWNNLLKIPENIGYNIWPIMVLATALFCVQFVLQPINSILVASQQPFKASIILLAGQLIALITTFILVRYTSGNLYVLVMVVSGSPVFAFLIATVYFFSTSFKSFIPKFKFIDVKSIKSLLNLGSSFFFVQIGALVLYETDNIIITRTLGPAEVATFNVAYKYFFILILVFNIVITPYWSAFTEAFTKNDFNWIKISFKKLRLIWLSTSVLAVLFYLLAGVFYKIWVGNVVLVPASLSLSLAIYVIVQNWLQIHSYFLNGTGKLRMQLMLIVGTAILNVPLSVFLIHREGIEGTVIANIAVIILMAIVLTFQCKLLINKRATGIWNK